MEKDESLDCKGLMCPMPIVRLAKKMKEMQVGKVLELVVDDPGSKEDVPAWCSRTGNELLGMKQEGNVFFFYIKKKVA
ncbi:MAG: sulfurtransferase TusA family protein [Methanomassiliicoccales archaeon]|jgi:tRNA 2-thiouridine synthesizing protein A